MKMNSTKKKLALSLAVAMVMSSAPVLSLQSFADVQTQKTDYEMAYEAVEALYANPYITGTDQEDIANAQEYINILPDGLAKTNLQNILNVVKVHNAVAYAYANPYLPQNVDKANLALQNFEGAGSEFLQGIMVSVNAVYDANVVLNGIWANINKLSNWDSAEYDLQKAELTNAIAGFEAAGVLPFLVEAFTNVNEETSNMATVLNLIDIAKENPTAANIQAAQAALENVTYPAAIENLSKLIAEVDSEAFLEVVSISAIEDINIEFAGEYTLPAEVEVTLSDATVVSVPVVWDETNIDVNVAGTYAVEGTLDLSALENVEATELKATVNVVVAEEVVEQLKVESVSAINANTILVTFEGIEEPVEIELEEALVHGQTEVTFVYNEVEYTAELTEAYVDPEVEAEEKLAAAITAAEEAIAALPTVEEVAIEDAQAVADAKALVEAVKALDAEAVVEGEEVIAELEAKIEELKAEQDAEEALAAATEAVVLAEESELQADVDAALALVNALPEGEDKDALVARLAVVQEAIDERVAAEEALAAATDAVVLAEESLLEADLADARELVDALEASDAKTLLQARINSVQLQIQGIIAAVNNANTEVKLYNALNIKPFVNVNIDNITAYDTALAARNATPYTTIAAIQTIIDTVNANAVNTDITTLVNNADTAVRAAETTPNGLVGVSGPKTLIEEAQEEIDKLPTEIPEAVATALNVNVTVKADLQERLDAVKVVVPVLEATNQIELLAALQNKAFDRVNEDLIATYESDLDGSQKTVVAIQGAIDAANLTAAQTAVTAAETAPLTAAKVATAQVLVNYLPEDVAPATTKADLQDRLDVVTALIAVADATTEAELLAALENEVLGLTDVNPAAIAEYKEEIDDNNADTTTAAKVQANVVNAGNTAALNAAVTDITTNFPTYDETDAADQAKALKELNRLADVSDLDKETIDVKLIEQYILAIAADLAGTPTIDGTDDPAAIQALINIANGAKAELARLAAVNAATDAYEMRTALTAVAIAESDGYVDLTSQEKLEVAELVLVARANETDEEFANTTAVTTAISTATSARSTFLTNVNAATSISTMVTALDVVEFPEFQALSDLEQVDAAEAVLVVLEALQAETPAAEFETISEIKTAAGL